MPDETAVAVEAESTAAAVETEQATESATEATSETQASETVAPPEKKGGVQRRIDELTRARRQAELDAEFWREKALRTAQPDKPGERVVADEPLKEPQPDDFETTAEYLQAIRAYDRTVHQREMREELAKAEQERETRTQQEILRDQYAEHEEAFTQKTPDYNEVVDRVMNRGGTGALQVAKGPGKGAVASAIQDDPEIAPQLLYHLGQNPEEVERIVALPPRQAYFAMAKLAARFAPETEGGEPKEPPPQTKVPKPPTPIKKVARADDGELRDDQNTDEWRRRFLKRMENARR